MLFCVHVVCLEWQCHDGKIFSLVWLNGQDDSDSQLLLSCGPDGVIVSSYYAYKVFSLVDLLVCFL